MSNDGSTTTTSNPNALTELAAWRPRNLEEALEGVGQPTLRDLLGRLHGGSGKHYAREACHDLSDELRALAVLAGASDVQIGGHPVWTREGLFQRLAMLQGRLHAMADRAAGCAEVDYVLCEVEDDLPSRGGAQ